MEDSERDARVVALLEDCVRTELTVTNGMLELGLSDGVIERLMEGVTSGVLQGFAVDWSPGWIGPGDIHAWEGPEGWFARCSTCLLDSPSAPNRDAAVAWARGHEASQ